jgi:hypothetical protein
MDVLINVKKHCESFQVENIFQPESKIVNRDSRMKAFRKYINIQGSCCALVAYDIVKV